MTGVKNKTAYDEMAKKIEEKMRTEQPEFAVIVFDINGLKQEMIILAMILGIFS